MEIIDEAGILQENLSAREYEYLQGKHEMSEEIFELLVYKVSGLGCDNTLCRMFDDFPFFTKKMVRDAERISE